MVVVVGLAFLGFPVVPEVLVVLGYRADLGLLGVQLVLVVPWLLGFLELLGVLELEQQQ